MNIPMNPTNNISINTCSFIVIKLLKISKFIKSQTEADQPPNGGRATLAAGLLWFSNIYCQ